MTTAQSCEKSHINECNSRHSTHCFNPYVVGVQCSSVEISANPANSSMHGFFLLVVDHHTIVDLEPTCRGLIDR